MTAFNYRRLDLARRLRGLSKGELAKRAGITQRALHLHATGEFSPNTVTVTAMAGVVGFPEHFFFGPDLDEPSVDASSFRAMTRLTARRRDQALALGALALHLSDWIQDQGFVLPAPSVPTLAGLTPETAAMAVRSEWGLGERPVKNMIHLAELHGVRVFSLSEDCVEMDAFSFWRGTEPYMFLNTMKSPEHGRFDVAHELGHLVLHHRGSRDRLSENEADKFASAFLMPRGDLTARAPRRPTVRDPIAAKKIWGVSVAALTYRMHSVGLITDWQYRALFMEISRRGYRKAEPESGRAERSQVLDKVLAILRDDGLSRADIADALGIPAEDLTRIVFGLVLTPLEGDRHRRGAAQPRPNLNIVK